MKLREDPLSIALLAGAAVLTAMYFVEQSGARELRQKEEAALSIDVSEIEGCVTHSAEFSGDTLVVKCPASRETIVERFQGRAPAFKTFVAVGTNGRMSCPNTPGIELSSQCNTADL